jgi:hypothetical protein
MNKIIKYKLHSSVIGPIYKIKNVTTWNQTGGSNLGIFVVANVLVDNNNISSMYNN